MELWRGGVGREERVTSLSERRSLSGRFSTRGKKGNDVNKWRKPEHRAERQSVSWQGEIRWLGSQRCFPGIQSRFDTLCLSTAHLYVIELEPLGKKRSHRHREWTREAAKAFFFPSFLFFFFPSFLFYIFLFCFLSNQDLVRLPWSATSGKGMLKES